MIDGVGDDRLRVILYHIPQVSGVPISLDLIARLRAAYPEQVVGIKDSFGEIDNMLAIIERFAGFFACSRGADPLLLPLLRQGGAGCITATANLVARDLRDGVPLGERPRATPPRWKPAQARIVAWRTVSQRLCRRCRPSRR